MRPLDELMGIPPANMTEEEILKAIEFHRRQIAGKVGTPNIYTRLADLEREAEQRKLKPSRDYHIAISLYNPQMKRLKSKVVDFICKPVAKDAFKQAVDALEDRNWLVMNHEDIKSSFENLTDGMKPTASDIIAIDDKMGRILDGGAIIGHINEVLDNAVQDYIDKHYVEKMDQVIP